MNRRTVVTTRCGSLVLVQLELLVVTVELLVVHEQSAEIVRELAQEQAAL